MALAEECRGSKAFTDAFESQATDIAPALWKLLVKNGFKLPWSFDAVSDLDAAETLAMLEGFFRRLPRQEEINSYYEILTLASAFAARHRKMVVAALDRPELRSQKRQTDHGLERYNLLAKLDPRLLLPADHYPVANKKAKTDREAVRGKLVDRLCRVIVLCDLPAAQLIVGSIAPERILQRFGAGRRISTLKQKLQSFGQLHRWCLASLGKNFPEKAVELLDFILERADEPCGPSVPGSILSMVAFLEEIGGRPVNERLASDTAVKSIVDELKLELSSARPRAKRKANQMMIGFALSMEATVCDSSAKTYVRLLAWTKLLRIWASLRSSDTAGIPASSIRMEGQDLFGCIEESKTTGRGKAVSVLPFFVSGKAWLCCEGWLREGWELFKLGDRQRTFLLPLPTADYSDLSDKEPSFIQNCTSFRKLLSETKCIGSIEVSDDGLVRAKHGDELLLAPGCQSFWAEHSDRATVPSWAAAMLISKYRRDFLGRWKPEESDMYVRTAKTIVLGVQEEVALRLRSAGFTDVVSEDTLLEELAKYCTTRGMEQYQLETMLQSLRDARKFGMMVPAVEPEIDSEWDSLNAEPADAEVLPEFEGPEEPTQLSLGSWVVSMTKGGSAKTLHKVGACWRRPGVHYQRFVMLDAEEVTNCSLNLCPYNKVCTECFPSGVPESDSSSSSESDDSDSSSA